MEQHLQDLKYGGRPMNKNELRIKELEKENKQLKEAIDKAIEYLEAKRIREKAIVDIDVLEGILKEVK